MKIFLIAGEASGDVIGARLVSALKAGGEVECAGIGGPLMEEAGMEVLLPMDTLSVMGVWEVIPKLPDLLKIYKGVLEEIEKRNPDVVITIDSPDFNFRVMSALKKRGKCKAKRIHYVAPSVWAWRPGRAKAIAQYLDGLVCLFPFEPPYFKKHGLKTVVAGHPLAEEEKVAGDGKAFREANDIPENAKTVGLYFGSRERELAMMSEIIKNAAAVLCEDYPDLHVIVPTLPKLEYELVKRMHGFQCPVRIVSKQNLKWDAMAACDMAIAVSGTVGLELAFAGVPHIIAYKMSPATWAMVRMLVKVKHAHLANILLKREVVPEFLQGKCEAVKIAEGASALMKSEQQQAFQKKGFAKLRELIGVSADKEPPSVRAAQFVYEICGKSYRLPMGTNGRLAGPV